jgi:hypothetical protein
MKALLPLLCAFGARCVPSTDNSDCTQACLATQRRIVDVPRSFGVKLQALKLDFAPDALPHAAAPKPPMARPPRPEPHRHHDTSMPWPVIKPVGINAVRTCCSVRADRRFLARLL